MPPSRAFVFDAYGTLFDVHSAAMRHRERIGPEWQRLTETWRAKQLEYTWIEAGIGRDRSFRQLTSDSLDYAIAATGGVAPGVREALLESYATLDAYPEVAGVLARLRAGGARLAILSNGDPDMLAEAVAAAGLGGQFEAVISVAAAGTYKPKPAVYRLATDALGVTAGDVTFVSSNRWDVAGAKAFGFRCVWVNRRGLPDEYAQWPADRIGASLESILTDQG